jgi:hypothetical protein
MPGDHLLADGRCRVAQDRTLSRAQMLEGLLVRDQHLVLREQRDVAHRDRLCLRDGLELAESGLLPLELARDRVEMAIILDVRQRAEGVAQLLGHT